MEASPLTLMAAGQGCIYRMGGLNETVNKGNSSERIPASNHQIRADVLVNQTCSFNKVHVRM